MYNTLGVPFRLVCTVLYEKNECAVDKSTNIINIHMSSYLEKKYVLA
jgi:hypothetical protein